MMFTKFRSLQRGAEIRLRLSTRVHFFIIQEARTTFQLPRVVRDGIGEMLKLAE